MTGSSFLVSLTGSVTVVSTVGCSSGSTGVGSVIVSVLGVFPPSPSVLFVGC